MALRVPPPMLRPCCRPPPRRTHASPMATMATSGMALTMVPRAKLARTWRRSGCACGMTRGKPGKHGYNNGKAVLMVVDGRQTALSCSLFSYVLRLLAGKCWVSRIGNSFAANRFGRLGRLIASRAAPGLRTYNLQAGGFDQISLPPLCVA